jgi:hypothetical protein
MVHTIFNILVLTYFFLSTAHLIWQLTKIPKGLENIRLQIWIALLFNLIVLSIGTFLFFNKNLYI